MRGTCNSRRSFSLSFPKIQSVGIRAVRENQRIIRCDVCDRPPACNVGKGKVVSGAVGEPERPERQET
jgi:hypothetical protein